MASLPPGLTEDDCINDSLWNFYSPEEVNDMEIIFFHGLQLGNFEDAFWSTWVAKGDKNLIWPREWLSEKFPKARIFSVTYNSSATVAVGQMDMHNLGENLVHDIIQSRDWNIGQTKPVFLVGHCLGGTVIKQFILSAIEKKNEMTKNSGTAVKRIDNFLKNFKGAFFYATPHAGSEAIEKLAERLQTTSPILGLMKRLSTQTARINEKFRNHRENLNARTYGLAEVLPTKSLEFNEVVVVEASVRSDVDECYTHTTADHFTICQARNRRDSTVIGKLVDFITNNVLAETITKREQAEVLL